MRDFERKEGPRRQMNETADAWAMFCKRVEVTDSILQLQKSAGLPYSPVYMSDDALRKWVKPEVR